MDEMNNVINGVYNEVKNRCMLPSNEYGIGAWDHHIELVYKIAIEICDKYNANYEIVALAALLHDVASITNKEYTEEHHIIGADIAEELLKEYGLEESKIELIKKCILNHRGSRVVDKISPEEICVADSDAMAHFYSVASLLKMVYVEKNMSIDEGSNFVLKKLERSYNKLSSQGKKIISNYYKAAKLLLSKK